MSAPHYYVDCGCGRTFDGTDAASLARFLRVHVGHVWAYVVTYDDGSAS